MRVHTRGMGAHALNMRMHTLSVRANTRVCVHTFRVFFPVLLFSKNIFSSQYFTRLGPKSTFGPHSDVVIGEWELRL